MNRCPNCAAQNRDGAKFCTSCGFRLPSEAPVAPLSDRSPFATTSTMPTYPAVAVEKSPNGDSVEESGFATWGSDSFAPPEPGKSWHADPPLNTAVPVSDEMIASLVNDVDTDQAPESAHSEPIAADAPVEHSVEEPLPQVNANSSIDDLLKLARAIEYGLIELADSPQAAAEPPGDIRLLRNAMADLQSEEDIAPLRNAISTAQERPRDVDVMLDLVLRADSFAAVLTERDQLRAAISLFLATDQSEPEETVTAEPDETSDLDDEEQTDEVGDFEPPSGNTDDQVAI